MIDDIIESLSKHILFDANGDIEKACIPLKKVFNALEKLRPILEEKETVEKYLYENSVLDGKGNMDGSFVPISIAMIAVEQALKGNLRYEKPSWIRH